MSNTFNDENTENQLKDAGYVVLSPLGENVMAQAWDIYHRFNSGVDEGFYTSLHSASREYRESVNMALRKLFEPLLAPFFKNHRMIAAGFVVKHPGQKSHLPYHQDWNMVDESLFESVNFWLPLTPLTPENGPLFVMPGSHKKLKVLRGSPGLPSPLGNIPWDSLQTFFSKIDLNPGEAVVHYNRLVHYSPANISDEPRVAILLTLAPKEAELLHYFVNEEGLLECYSIQPEFFTSFVIGQRPSFPLKGGPFKYEVPKVTLEEIK